MAFGSLAAMYASLFLLYFAVVWAVRQLFVKRYVARPVHRDLAAAGVLGLLTLGFFLREALDASTVTPAGGGDLGMLLYPSYHFAARSLKAGILPLWNPYLYCGFPFAADVQSALFYPINLVFFWVAPEITYHSLEFLAAFHVFLAGLLMYAMLRLLPPALVGRRIGPLAATLGGVAYMFCDFFVVHVGNLNLIAATAYLPLAFGLVALGAVRGSLLLSGLGGAAAGVALLAGHVQPFLYILLTLALFAAWRLVSGTTSRRASLGREAVCFAVVGVAALGMAAAQLLPSLELTQLSLRSSLTYEESVAYSLPPAELPALVAPGFFGRGPEGYWGPWDRVETGYIGVLPLALAALALVLRREPLVRFLALLLAVGLFVALGGASVLHGWLWALAPGFGNLRAPARAVLVLSFAASALAALGLEALLHPLSSGQRRLLAHYGRVLLAGWLLGAGVVLPLALLLLLQHRDADPDVVQRLSTVANGIALALLFGVGSLGLLWARRYRWLSPGVFGAAAVGWAALDLIGGGANVDVGPGLPLKGFEHPAAIAFLRAELGDYRVDTVTNVWDVWQPNATLRYGLSDVMGGHNPLMLADYDRYWGNLGSRSTPLYDLLSARFIVGHKDVRLDWKKWSLAFDADPQVNIYRNATVLPRAQLVSGVRVAPRQDMLAELKRPDFDPTREVILEAGEPRPSTGGPVGVASIESGSPNEVVVAVAAAAPAYLVLSDVYYPGWRAYIDGRPAPVERANYAFRAVAVPPGEHVVRFSFEPDSVRWGMAISGATVLLLLAGAGVGAVRALTRRRTVLE